MLKTLKFQTAINIYQFKRKQKSCTVVIKYETIVIYKNKSITLSKIKMA